MWRDLTPGPQELLGVEVGGQVVLEGGEVSWEWMTWREGLALSLDIPELFDS